MRLAIFAVSFSLMVGIFEPSSALASNLDRSDDVRSTSKQIFQAAQTSVGKEMWRGYGLSNGKLGCAAAISNVLKKAGVNGILD